MTSPRELGENKRRWQQESPNLCTAPPASRVGRPCAWRGRSKKKRKLVCYSAQRALFIFPPSPPPSFPFLLSLARKGREKERGGGAGAGKEKKKEPLLPPVPFRFFPPPGGEKRAWGGQNGSYLVDPASSHMLVSKIKPCMSKYKQLYCETANGSLHQL